MHSICFTKVTLPVQCTEYLMLFAERSPFDSAC